MTLRAKIFRCVAIVAAIVAMCMRSSCAMGQDDPVRVSCQVVKITANGKTYSQVQYARFNSVRRAQRVKNDLVRAVAAENAIGATGTEIADALKKSEAKWEESRPNGSFDVTVMSGQAIVVFCDKEEAEVIEIKDGKTQYEITVQMRRSLRDVVVTGENRPFKPTFKKVPSMDTGYETQFNVNVMLPEGWTKDDSRLILQPMVIDCQTEDTIAYLDPMVYEGAEYHSLQDRRMRFDFYGNDPLAPAFKTSITLADDQPFFLDTTVVFRKPNKDKTYKGMYYCVLEDYHTDYYSNGGEGTGSCLAFRPFKFLDFSVASAQLDITDFKVEAESQFSTVPRNLKLTFEVNSDVLTSDSANTVELDKLIDELKSYGSRLFRVRVEGTASPDGDFEKNKALAARRASRALSIIRRGLGDADVQLPEPTVRVCTWDEVVAVLQNNGTDTAIVSMVRRVIDSNESRNVTGALRGLPFYQSTIMPALESLRAMTCSYSYERDHVLTPDEAVEAYYMFKEDYKSGKKKFSDGDYYNLFSAIKDSAELDTITDMAYRQITAQPGYEMLTFAPYVANRMALLNMRRGVPDPSVLKPFIDYGDRRVPAKKYVNNVMVTRNLKEMIINQAIIYFQEQQLDTAQYLVDWVPKDSITSKLEKFIAFERYFIKYIAGQCTPEEEKICNAAYKYVVESNITNKAIIFSELHSQLNKTREEAEEYVDQMDDSNAKKWYLKGILWSSEAGKEPPVGLGGTFKQLSDNEMSRLMRDDYEAYLRYAEEETRYAQMLAEAGGDKTPYFLAYFQHSFDLQPKYRNLYANEGNVSDDIREKYPYDEAKADAYRRKFDMLYAATKKAPAEKPAEEAAAAADGDAEKPVDGAAGAAEGGHGAESAAQAAGGDVAAPSADGGASGTAEGETYGSADTNGNETK